MLYYIGSLFPDTPLRLLSSYLVLISIGSLLSTLLVLLFLPKLWKFLPRDRGKSLVRDGAISEGKPTGAGLAVSLLTLPGLLLAVPVEGSCQMSMVGLYTIMLFGFLDDHSRTPWGEFRKGMLDAICCILCALAMYLDGMNDIWLPFTKRIFYLPLWAYLPVATAVLFISVNSLNCSDGVDGLAGSLGIMSLLSLTGLLYLVLGYRPVAEYLLLPHYASGARWAVLSATVAGGYAGYLWYNAEPSQVLMGDAGSRMLGLAIGIAVLASGNPLLIFVFAPVIFADGGTGLVKLTLLRLFKKLGFNTTPPSQLPPEKAAEQNFFIRSFHKVRFPLHDHCRYVLGWSRSQILIRFMLVQAFLAPALFAIFTKVR